MPRASLDESDSYEFLPPEPKSLLGATFCLVSFFLSVMFITIAYLQPIRILKDVLSPGNSTTPEYVSVMLTPCIVHLATVSIFGTYLWMFDNKTRFFLGSLIAAGSTVGFDFIADLTASHGFIVPLVIRCAQEIGLSLCAYALPALICNEMESSANVLLPLLSTARGGVVFLGVSLNNWLRHFGLYVPFSTVAVGIGSLGILSICMFDGNRDWYRRRSYRTKSFSPNWDIVLVESLNFSSFFILMYLILVLPEVLAEQHHLSYNFLLHISGTVYIITGPVTGMLVRWLPPRGVLYILSSLTGVVSMILLGPVLTWSARFGLIAVSTILLALGNGLLPTLVHMHLLDNLSPDGDIRNRHHVASARLVSSAATLAIQLASLTPALVNLLSLQISLYVPLALCSLVTLMLVGTYMYEIFA